MNRIATTLKKTFAALAALVLAPFAILLGLMMMGLTLGLAFLAALALAVSVKSGAADRDDMASDAMPRAAT